MYLQQNSGSLKNAFSQQLIRTLRVQTTRNIYKYWSNNNSLHGARLQACAFIQKTNKKTKDKKRAELLFYARALHELLCHSLSKSQKVTRSLSKTYLHKLMR